jgi:hypothetical protein
MGTVEAFPAILAEQTPLMVILYKRPGETDFSESKSLRSTNI